VGREPSINWRDLVPSVLVPNFFYASGQGAIVPIVPLFAIELGASLSVAAAVAAMLSVGQLAGTLPAGLAVGRLGERRTMLLAVVVCIVGAALAFSATQVWLLMVGVIMIGLAASAFQMARHAYMTVAVAVAFRGRAFSLVAGANRLGVLLGPFLSAWLLKVTDHLRAAFVVTAASSVLIAVVLLRFATHDGTATRHAPRDARPESMPVAADGVFRTLVRRRDVLMRLGVSASLLSGLRTSRQIIIPLWGASIGVADVNVALLVGVCAGIDVALFYVGGYITDRLGRLWVALPTLALFAGGHLALALTAHAGSRVNWYVAVAVTMSVANGVSSALVAAMGADLADQRNPATFLTSWRLVAELGPSGIPLVMSAVTALASLAAASATMGVLAVGGAFSMWRYVPRYLPRRRR
jgi:MFS family permease